MGDVGLIFLVELAVVEEQQHQLLLNLEHFRCRLFAAFDGGRHSRRVLSLRAVLVRGCLCFRALLLETGLSADARGCRWGLVSGRCAMRVQSLWFVAALVRCVQPVLNPLTLFYQLDILCFLCKLKCELGAGQCAAYACIADLMRWWYLHSWQTPQTDMRLRIWPKNTTNLAALLQMGFALSTTLHVAIQFAHRFLVHARWEWKLTKTTYGHV